MNSLLRGTAGAGKQGWVMPSRPELFQITAAGGGKPLYREFVKKKKKEARRKAAK